MDYINHKFIPDLDLYYRNNLNLAKDLCEEIKRCKCDSIKIAMCVQNPVDKYSELKDQWIDPEGIQHSDSLFNTFEKRLVTKENAKYFASYISETFKFSMVSIYDHESVKICKNFFNCAKIPSNNLNNFPLIQEIANEFNNIIIDTKKTNKNSLLKVLEFIKKCNKDINIAIQFSPSRPPAKSNKWNLDSIKYLKNEFKEYNPIVGLSEHSNSIDQSLIAIGLGASFIEKGIMPDYEYENGDSDSAHCIPISHFREWHTKIIDGFSGIGCYEELSENIFPENVRLFFRKDMKKGEKITIDDIYCKFSDRGSNGIQFESFINKKLLNSVLLDQPVSIEDVCS
tara:strand:- start:1187 stop:2209 length:1023 start_codon:yes stop_codon:yes gene_type:complete